MGPCLGSLREQQLPKIGYEASVVLPGCSQVCCSSPDLLLMPQPLHDLPPLEVSPRPGAAAEGGWMPCPTGKEATHCTQLLKLQAAPRDWVMRRLTKPSHQLHTMQWLPMCRQQVPEADPSLLLHAAVRCSEQKGTSVQLMSAALRYAAVLRCTVSRSPVQPSSVRQRLTLVLSHLSSAAASRQ